jgi:methylthioribose-1-phosphate isomerase
MRVDGVHYRSIWVNDDGETIDIIDQRQLPQAFEIINLATLADACAAIRDMAVRGAPLIGATAAYGLYLALREDAGDEHMQAAAEALLATRPTAVNLRWALERMRARLAATPPAERTARALAEADEISRLDVDTNRSIGEHGLALIREIAARKGPGEAVNILTHCNAGWLATVDWGTATAPIYQAHDAGIALHVWVDETRPRNQGALTAWELGHHGVAHTYIVDNAGGHLMQQGRVDLCLVGSDRTTYTGDVCNKIGTYLKALAAYDNGVPFYVCLPGSTIDWQTASGERIPIEQRAAEEITEVSGALLGGGRGSVSVIPLTSPVANYAFDVTPARLVSGLITERGILAASEAALRAAFARE